MRRIAIFLFWVLPTGALADFDPSRIPAAFCESPEKLLWGAQSCQDNRRLADGAERCFAKLENLERSLGKDAQAIASTELKTQVGQVSLGNKEYDFSDRALGYLTALATLARKELEPFPAFLLAPLVYYQPAITGNDPDGFARRLDCHGGNEKRIRRVQQALAAKILRFQARQREARLHQRSLQQEANGLKSDSNSLVQIDKRQPQSPTAPQRRPASFKASSITGVEEDQAKRLPAVQNKGSK